MRYNTRHKQETRRRIVEAARALFNRHGLTGVSIDQIMAAAGLTRGGFYNHFDTKDELYAETLIHYAECREEEGKEMPVNGPDVAQKILHAYVSPQHRNHVQSQCPLMALPSDVARASPVVRAAYQRVLEAMVDAFQSNLGAERDLPPRQYGLAMASICVGAMVLARTVDDDDLIDEICEATRAFAANAMGWV